MSSQFYDYLRSKLVTFFTDHPLVPGDRFLINFDNVEQVNDFYKSLEKESSSSFEYSYGEEFNSFKTFLIKFGDVELIVANSSVTSDFLVTLRNNVSKLEGDWKNKALLIISEDVKDSINEGMVNLQDEGYPFSLSYISDNLMKDINKSNLSTYDCDVLNVFLNNEDTDSLYKSTLWDFEEVLSIIVKEKIDPEDYKGLNMFYDSSLDTISNSTSRRNRIKKNRELFLQIDDMVNFEDFDSKIEKKFDKKGIKELHNDNGWEASDFKVLNQSMEEYKNRTGRLNYLESTVSNKLVYWEKPEKDTIAGRRKRHIIIFNTENLEQVSIKFNFDRKLNRRFLSSSSKKDGSVLSKTLTFNIECNNDAPTFKKYIYEHENVVKNRFMFNICILNINPTLLSDIQSNFNVRSRNQQILINQDDGFLKLGDGDCSEVVITEEKSNFNISSEKAIEINVEESLYLDEDNELNFKVNIKSYIISFIIKKFGEKTPPIKATQVWDRKRVNQQDFIREDSKLIQGENGYNISSENFKKILDIEKAIIANRALFGSYDQDILTVEEIIIPDTIKNCYNELFDYYLNKNNIPSLVYLDDDLKRIYKKLIYYYNQEIESIPENENLSISNKKDLLKLGMIKYNDKLMFSSISPLNIAFQLEAYSQCGSEEIDYNIIESLLPNNLLPFTYNVDDNKLYRPITQDITNSVKEWIIYEEASEVSIGTTNIFIKKVVNEKLKQFVLHFKYLFKDNSKAPLKVNIINIDNDLEVVKGIFEFIRDRLPDKRKTGGVIPVEAHIYNIDGKTSFDTLFQCKNEDDFKKYFDMDLSSEGMDSLDILRLVQENINYYIENNSDNISYGYAHISFYKSINSSTNSSVFMNDIETGMSLNGLISVTTSNPSSSENVLNHEDYKTGFGIKHADLDVDLIRFAKNLNELAFNNQNRCLNPYRKNFSIVSLPDLRYNEFMDELFDKSHWVTFIEPNFGLDYFSDKSDLFIIHYSDQYSSSAKYDTITVTNKSNQYMQIIEEFLENSNLDDMNFTEKSIYEVIKIFNSINGEWLLHIGLNDSTEREKLSVVSAIKYVLSIFDHKDIIWVPISMEEILRVAGNVGLKETNGLFSVKNLIGKREGKYSDDLLLIGLNITNSEIYYYPVEVKLGLNNSNVIRTAKKQIMGTSKLFKEYLGQNGIFFKNKFYRNFFIQLFISNAKKLLENHIWDDKDFSLINNFKKNLLNDNYKISSKLESEIGIGAIISFKKDAPSHSAIIDENICLVELPDSDGYYGIIHSIEHINNLIQGGKTDIPPNKLLYSKDIASLEESDFIEGKIEEVESNEEIEEFNIDQDSSNDSKSNEESFEENISNSEKQPINYGAKGRGGTLMFGPDGGMLGITNTPEEINKTPLKTDENGDGNNIASENMVENDNTSSKDNEDANQLDDINSSIEKDDSERENDNFNSITEIKPLEDIRVLIGTLQNSNEKIYWEYGNPNLGNKHMLIQGKSGQGKTYFIQRILKELSDQHVPSIVIDYTDGFKLNQLEEEFKEHLGDNLKQYVVIRNKFPLNPFKRYMIDLGDGEPFMQDESEVADRFKSIISSVFPSLGNQQLNVLYEAVLSGMRKYGDEMDLKILKHELQNNSSGPAASLLNNLRGLLDKNPFDIESDFDWSILDERNGNVIIIQLTALQNDIQKIISEFILWDLWSYKTQNGSKENPFVVVLDESHNLDFGSNSPCGKILQEGRKFGWSAIFATQAVKSLFKPEEIAKLDNVEEKIFFHPTDNSMKSIADTISYDAKSKKEWENKLMGLNKGHCIVYAQIKNKYDNLESLKPYYVSVDSIDK